ncbi:MAG: hypothetical protein ACI4M8_02200 [Christensenellales bacterium]
MKRVEINEMQFKKLIDGVKHCVAKDDSRPILKYIQIKVKSDTITAYALDGYRAARVEIKNACPIEEEFTCHIKPFPFKVSKYEINPVIIEQSDGKTFVTFTNEYGVLRYGFTVPDGKFVDIEKIYADARQHDRELGLQPRYVIDALKALNGINRISKGVSYAVFESKENNLKPFIIRAKNDDIVNEQLILPVRVTEDE